MQWLWAEPSTKITISADEIAPTIFCHSLLLWVNDLKSTFFKFFLHFGRIYQITRSPRFASGKHYSLRSSFSDGRLNAIAQRFYARNPAVVYATIVNNPKPLY